MSKRHRADRVSRPAAVKAPVGATSTSASRRKALLFSWRPSLVGILHLAAISVIVVVVWCVAHNRTDRASWKVPLSYSGDDLQMLTWLRAASEFEYLPFAGRTNSRLGAPYHANWNDYPMYEPVLTFFIGVLARCSDLITAANVAIVAGFLASAASFYVCCRLLRWRREWASAGALLFAFSYYHTSRGLGHLLLSYDYTVPFAIMGVWLLIAGKRLRLGDRVFWLCAGTALVLGMGNPYNLSMWVQFLCLGLGARFLLLRRKGDLVIGGVLVALATFGFLAVNAHSLYYRMRHGENLAALSRNYTQLELYALKPIELVLPPWNHRLTCLGDIARQYSADAAVRGEMFSPYLGVIGLAALIWLAVEFAVRMTKARKVPRRMPSHAPLCSWVLLYSSIGGLNCFIGLVFGIMYFRGSNRYSIFILAIALFFLVSRMSRLVRSWNRAASYALAAGVAAIGLLDQLPLRQPEAVQRFAKEVQNDQSFCRRLEEKLPPGAMIFQMPVMNFIDGDPIERMMSYEHIRPYLWSKHLRFSFGSVQGRPREGWQRDVMSLPVEQGVKELERYGFAGLYLNRKAYKDGGEQWLRELSECGRTQRIEDGAGQQVCVLLKPSPAPAWPHSDDDALIVYKGDWSVAKFGVPDLGEQTGILIRSSPASMYFVNDRPESCNFRLMGVLTATSPRRLEIQFEGKSIWSEELTTATKTADVRLLARPGRNYLYFTSDRAPEPPADQPQAPRVSFGIIAFRIIKDPPTAP